MRIEDESEIIARRYVKDLEARNRKLEEALRPFGDFASHMEAQAAAFKANPADVAVYVPYEAAVIARAALSTTEDKT